MVVKEIVKLQKEAFQAWLTRESPETLDTNQEARWAAASAVTEARTRLWEELGEAIGKDVRLASKRFWKTD